MVRYRIKHFPVQRSMFCGTRVADFLLLPLGSSIAANSQQYCCPEAAIAEEMLLFRRRQRLVPVVQKNSTMNNPG